jgi:hypothetical protein
VRLEKLNEPALTLEATPSIRNATAIVSSFYSV